MYLNQFSWHHRPNIHHAISSAGKSGSAVFPKASQVARPLATRCVWWPFFFFAAISRNDGQPSSANTASGCKDSSF